MSNRFLVGSALAVLLALSGCATTDRYTTTDSGRTYQDGRYYSGYCDNCGVIEAIAVNQARPGVGAGAVIGGLAGAAVGSQVGDGRGQTAATILGAAGGAYAGHKIEQSQREKSEYRFTIRMQDGSLRTVFQADNPGLRVGDAVRIVNDSVVLR